MDKKIREENRRAMPKFLLILLACGFLGGMISVLLGEAAERGLGQNFLPWLESRIPAALPWILPVLMVPVILVHVFSMRKVRELKDAWDGDEEKTPELIDRKNDSLLVLHNITMGLIYLVFSASVVYQGQLSDQMIVLGEFVLCMAVLFFMQKQTIEFVRSMNPEKKGSVYDLKFCKAWAESCDEAEKQLMGQAAYSVYQTMTKVYILVWAVLIFLQLFAGVGLLPSVIVIGLFVTAQFTYWFQICRLTRRGR